MPGGALLVDPRDDHDIAGALNRLLTDDALYSELSRQARDRPERTWDEYAEETWQYLVDVPRREVIADHPQSQSGRSLTVSGEVTCAPEAVAHRGGQPDALGVIVGRRILQDRDDRSVVAD